MALDFNAPDIGSKVDNQIIGRGQTDPTGLNPLLNADGSVQQEDPQAQLLKQTIRRELTNPATDKLGMEDYYPGINRPINVGTFSGPMGSIPLLAAGQPHIPFAMLNALEKSKQETISKYQKEMLQSIVFDYLPIKNKIAGDVANNIKHTDDMEKYNTRLAKYGGNTLLLNRALAPGGAEAMEFAYEQNKWKNWGNAMNDNLDFSAQIRASREGGFQKLGDIVIKDAKGKKQAGDKSEETEESKFWQGGSKDLWVSDDAYNAAVEYQNMVTNPKLKLEDIEGYDLGKIKSAMATDGYVKQMTEILKNNDDLRTTIGSAFQDKLKQVTLSPYELDAKGNPVTDAKGNFIPNKSLNTNINDVYLSVEKSTLTDDYMKSIMMPLYENAYRGTEKPSFDEFYANYKPFVRQTLKEELKTIGKDNVWQKVAAQKSMYDYTNPVTDVTLTNEVATFNNGIGGVITVAENQKLTYPTGTIPDINMGEVKTFDPVTGKLDVSSYRGNATPIYSTTVNMVGADGKTTPVRVAKVSYQSADENGKVTDQTRYVLSSNVLNAEQLAISKGRLNIKDEQALQDIQVATGSTNNLINADPNKVPAVIKTTGTTTPPANQNLQKTKTAVKSGTTGGGKTFNYSTGKYE